MIVYDVVDDLYRPISRSVTRSKCRPREGAERFLEGVRGVDPELASYLRIEAHAPSG